MNSIMLPVKATWVEHSKVAGGKMVQVTKMSLGQKCHLDNIDTWTKMTLGQCSLGQ